MKGDSNWWKRNGAGFLDMYEGSAYSPKRIVGKFLNSRTAYINEWATPGGSVIDIGCGGGENLAEIAGRFDVIRGVDISPEMTKQAQERLKSFHAGKDIVIKTGGFQEAASFGGGHDLAMLIGVLDYLEGPEPLECLKTVGGSLRQGGVAIITAPKTPSVFSFLRTGVGSFIKKRIFGLPQIISAFTEDEIKSMLKTAGLEMEAIAPIWDAMWMIRCVRR